MDALLWRKTSFQLRAHLAKRRSIVLAVVVPAAAGIGIHPRRTARKIERLLSAGQQDVRSVFGSCGPQIHGNLPDLLRTRIELGRIAEVSLLGKRDLRRMRLLFPEHALFHYLGRT